MKYGAVTMANRIPDEVIDRIRHSVDIVDVISDYVQLKNKGAIILDSVRFMGKAHHLFQYRLINKFIIALDAVQEGIHFHS